MKKIQYISLILSANLFTVGTALSLSEINNAGIFLTAGFCILILVSLPAGLFIHFTGSGRKNRALYIIGYLCALFLLSSILMLYFHVSGSLAISLLGFSLPFILFLPLFLKKNKQSEQPARVHQFALFMLTLAACIGLQSLNLSKDIIESMRFSASETEPSIYALNKRNEKLYNKIFSDNISDTTIVNRFRKATSSCYSEIDDVKVTLAAYSSQNNISSLNKFEEPDIMIVNNFTENQLNYKFMYQMGKINNLKKRLERAADLLMYYSPNSSTAKLVNALIPFENPSKKVIFANGWKNGMFPKNATVLAYLGSLNMLEYSLRLSENVVLEGIAGKRNYVVSGFNYGY